MPIYEMMNDAIYSNNLIECGEKLIAFADAVMAQKNRSTVVNQFYERLTEYALTKYLVDEDDTQYRIVEGHSTISLFLLSSLSPKETPTKSLKKIKALGERITTQFTKPIGTRISKENIEAIMKYLDVNYNFSQKVYSNRKSNFLLMKNSNIEFNSQCSVGNDESKKIIQQLFLYHMRTNDDDTPSPEYVFIHELAHALHARLTGSMEIMPQGVMEYLNDTCFPEVITLTKEQQGEILADVLAMGIMYDTPFAAYDPFTPIREQDKKYFKDIFEKLIEMITV